MREPFIRTKLKRDDRWGMPQPEAAGCAQCHSIRDKCDAWVISGIISGLPRPGGQRQVDIAITALTTVI